MTRSTDASGQVQSTELTSYFFGGAYEVRDTQVIKYYSFAGQTIAMRDANGLQYFLTDHLGSIVAVTDSNGTLTSQQRYLPFGAVRELPNYPTTELTTDYGYTGQRSLGGDLGLMDYRARFYDPYLSRFLQPDSLIPSAGNPQAFNRYSYVLNSPVQYTDPSGYCEKASYSSNVVTDDECYPSLTNIQFSSDGNDGGGDLENNRNPWTDPEHADWFSGQYSGCTLCHYAHVQGKSILTNQELAIADQNFRQWAAVGYTPIVATTLTLGAPAIGSDSLWMAASACIQSPICRWLTGMAGGTGTSQTLKVVNSEAKGPIKQYDVTVLGKDPAYRNLGTDLGAKILNDPKWTVKIQEEFMRTLIKNQDFVVLSDPLPNTGWFQIEGQQLFNSGYNYAYPFFIPPSFIP